MAMDKEGLTQKIIEYLTGAKKMPEKYKTNLNFKTTGYMKHLACAIACSVVDEIQENAEVNGGSVVGAGPVSKAKVS